MILTTHDSEYQSLTATDGVEKELSGVQSAVEGVLHKAFGTSITGKLKVCTCIYLNITGKLHVFAHMHHHTQM